MQMQQAVEASLLDAYCPGTEDTISPEMQAQQQELLLFYQRQQSACTVPATDASTAQAQQPPLQHADGYDRTNRDAGQQEGTQKAAAVPKKEHSSDHANSLKLTLSQECSDESTSSAEASISAQQLPGNKRSNLTLLQMLSICYMYCTFPRWQPLPIAKAGNDARPQARALHYF